MSRQLSRLLAVANAVVLAGLGLVTVSTFGRVEVVPESILTPLVLGAFSVAALLMLTMLIACSRDEALSAGGKRRWELWLVVGGPITSFAYFLRRAKHGA